MEGLWLVVECIFFHVPSFNQRFQSNRYRVFVPAESCYYRIEWNRNGNVDGVFLRKVQGLSAISRNGLAPDKQLAKHSGREYSIIAQEETLPQ